MTRMGDARHHEITTGEVVNLAVQGVWQIVWLVAPLAIAAIVATAAATQAQGGFVIATEALQIDLKRLNPATGFKRLAPSQSGLNLVKTVIATAVVGTVAWAAIDSLMQEAPRFALLDPVASGLSAWEHTVAFLKRAAIALLALAAGDFGLQTYRTSQSLKMTKQEVKDDNKLAEGNPEIKARVRRVQREMARKRMLAAVPKATVIITNPTHFAVALQYTRGQAAPEVVAKGADALAAEDPDDCARARRADRREPAAGAGHLQAGRGGRVDPRRSVRGGGRSAGVPDSAQAAGVVREKSMAMSNSRPFGPAQLLVPGVVILVLALMVLPLPPVILDLLLSVDIALSVVLLLTAVYVKNPIEFSVFPSLLLLLTLLRLSLNVAGTRLILLHGAEGVDAAGHVIMSFGQFVVGGNFVVGVVIFLVLIAIQYVVINHGAVRISEVTARFTLDAMPGKQMSIDADLNAGTIDDKEAKRRRDNVREEAEFYGAMDGAIRFTQRDSLAALLITGVNIVAGLVIGVMQYDMDIVDAAKTYTILTIGDGLVTAIPCVAGVDVGRPDHHPRLVRVVARRGRRHPVAHQDAAAGHRRGGAVRDGARPRAPQDGLLPRRGGLRVCGLRQP